jgi:L-aminopeptidase/D-esterase-like protein
LAIFAAQKILMTPPANLITDVPGLAVGNAEDAPAASGVTAVIFDEPATASIAILGGAPGVRDAALLEPEMTVERVDALVLSGGSVYGLDAMGGALAFLREQGRVFAIGDARAPIVPGAILFDLLNGGDKNWGRKPPYWDLGYEAATKAARFFSLGSAGAGLGANTANLKGGLGSTSAITSNGYWVGALVAVNSVGQATIGDSAHFWAAPFERGREFGGLGWPHPAPASMLDMRLQTDRLENTTIAVVATDAMLTKPQAKRLAIQSHDGMAHALRPAHSQLDGDIVFAASTARNARSPEPRDLAEIGMIAADCLARSIARGVYEATALNCFAVAFPAWRDLFAKAD